MNVSYWAIWTRKTQAQKKAGSLQWAYMAIARLGGFMDSKRTGIASWGALW